MLVDVLTLFFKLFDVIITLKFNLQLIMIN